MTYRRGVRASSLVALVCLAGGASLRAQPNVEDQARRQLESGREFYRAGRYAEAIKDFQTVAEGYPTSTVADDALLAVAEYQLDIARDPITARSITAPRWIAAPIARRTRSIGCSGWRSSSRDRYGPRDRGCSNRGCWWPRDSRARRCERCSA